MGLGDHHASGSQPGPTPSRLPVSHSDHGAYVRRPERVAAGPHVHEDRVVVLPLGQVEPAQVLGLDRLLVEARAGSASRCCNRGEPHAAQLTIGPQGVATPATRRCGRRRAGGRHTGAAAPHHDRGVRSTASAHRPTMIRALEVMSRRVAAEREHHCTKRPRLGQRRVLRLLPTPGTARTSPMPDSRYGRTIHP